MLRDENNLIIQEGDDLWLSGGDSAFATGIMAFSGSKLDQELMPYFVFDNFFIVRNPYQERWNRPELTSRDQVIAFFAGLPEFKFFQAPNRFDLKVHLLRSCLHYAKSWRVNSDILSFNHKFYLYKCANATPPPWLYPLAYLNQALDLLWSCFIKPDHEMNQSIVMNCVFGKRWIRFLYKWHPDLEKNVKDYFCGWRNKCEVYEMLWKKVLKEIE